MENENDGTFDILIMFQTSARGKLFIEESRLCDVPEL
jgi:hypothetical protein